MHARDQSSIFSIGGKFRPDYWLLLELHTLTLVTRSYALLIQQMFDTPHNFILVWGAIFCGLPTNYHYDLLTQRLPW